LSKELEGYRSKVSELSSANLVLQNEVLEHERQTSKLPQHHENQFEEGRGLNEPDAELRKELDDVSEQLATCRARVEELERTNPLEVEYRALEDELEMTRRRASELAHQAEESERQLVEQRRQWEKELSDLRMILESRRERVDVSTDLATAPKTSRAADGNPVIESVLAQFARLQRDAASRRSSR
jgi:uncharacterized protein YfbU (UPF0304 family)